MSSLNEPNAKKQRTASRIAAAASATIFPTSLPVDVTQERTVLPVLRFSTYFD
jgi:hypothetical protein